MMMFKIRFRRSPVLQSLGVENVDAQHHKYLCTTNSVGLRAPDRISRFRRPTSLMGGGVDRCKKSKVHELLEAN